MSEKLEKKYQKKIETLEKRIALLEEKLKFFEKMIEVEDYDFFITCPYCNFEFQTDYDEEVTDICCPECGQSFDVEWDDDENSNK